MSSLGWTRSEAAAKTAPITPASPMMEGSMKVWSAMLAAAPAASAKYCSDERPCTPCFSNNGPCEDAPAASGVDTSTNEAWAARAQEKIEAMDAASGGEACGCIYYGLGKAAPYLCEMHKARKADPHPPPAASVSERARELVKRWRECAKSAANGPMFDGASEYAVAGTYIDCADELESLLSAASGEGVG